MCTRFIPKATTTAMVALAVCVVAGVLMHPTLRAQSSQSRTPKTQPPTPQWQIDAGGHAKFDVASVKQVDPRSNVPFHANVETSGNDNFVPTGGLYSVDATLRMFITFAYKLNPYGWYSLPSQIPKWANTTGYDVEARAPGNPTKDRYRLMMQALLADRFKLVVHWEMKQIPVMAVVFDKPGKLGPRIRPHSDDVPCPAEMPLSGQPAISQKMISGDFPERCGMSMWVDSGRFHMAGRNVPMSMFMGYFMADPGTKPVVNKTGLTGNYDFALEYSSDHASPGYQPDSNGPTWVEALKNQLGFKLKSETDPVETLVIDHVEEPSAN
jgi:uncharacterized protein (TIGR03435 family)